MKPAQLLGLNSACCLCRQPVGFRTTLTHTCGESKPPPRIMRSDIYWFAEICNSQCLSHFAASFIASRAEVSIVKGVLSVLVCTMTTGFAQNGRSYTGLYLWHYTDKWRRSSAFAYGSTRQHACFWTGYQSTFSNHCIPAVHLTNSKSYVWMILPQVHLRKPCYDLSFL